MMAIGRFSFSFLLPALCLLILVSVRSIDGQENQDRSSFVDDNGKCIKDGYFKNDCNSCNCKKGYVAYCTLMGCIGTVPGVKVSPNGRCQPGEKWKLDECNNCTCTHTGYASCTLNECSPKKKVKRSTTNSKMDKQGRCKPGDKWQLDECNTCSCTHTGYASCTLNDCKNKKRGKRSASIGKPLDMKKREAKPWKILGNSGNECRAGHSWKENCNSCFCSERGIAMCTDMACPTPPPPPKN